MSTAMGCSSPSWSGNVIARLTDNSRFPSPLAGAEPRVRRPARAPAGCESVASRGWGPATRSAARPRPRPPGGPPRPRPPGAGTRPRRLRLRARPPRPPLEVGGGRRPERPEPAPHQLGPGGRGRQLGDAAGQRRVDRRPPVLAAGPRAAWAAAGDPAFGREKEQHAGDQGADAAPALPLAVAQ